VLLYSLVARQSRRAKLCVLPLTTAISTAMLSCSSNPREWRTNADIKICVDDLDKRVPDGDCSNPGDQHHRWYYINEGGYVPYPGYPVRSGSYQPLLRAAHTVLLQAAPMWQLLNPPEQAL